MTEQEQWALIAATQDVIDMAARVLDDHYEHANFAVCAIGIMQDLVTAMESFREKGGRLTEELEVAV